MHRRGIRRQAADKRCRDRHRNRRQEQRAATLDAVADVAEQRAADQAHDVPRTEHAEHRQERDQAAACGKNSCSSVVKTP